MTSQAGSRPERNAARSRRSKASRFSRTLKAFSCDIADAVSRGFCFPCKATAPLAVPENARIRDVLELAAVGATVPLLAKFTAAVQAVRGGSAPVRGT